MSAAFPKEKAEEKPRKPRRPENDLQSFLGQENWRLRIRKERLHAAPLPEFSVKQAMRALDVPKKPCQVQPRWLDESSLEAEFRKELTVKRSPREHLLWPETSQHQVGWLVEDSLGLPMAQRPTLHGSPPKLGFGWHRRFADKDFEPMVPSPSTPSTASGSRRPAAPAPAPAPQILEMPSPAEQTLPWFPGIGKLRRQRRLQRKQAREPEPRCELRPQSALVQPLGQCGDSRPPSALPGNSAGFRIAVQRPVEDEPRQYALPEAQHCRSRRHRREVPGVPRIPAARSEEPLGEASPGDARRRGHAAANFEAAGQNELPVCLGDVLEILESHPTGWSWARSVSGGNCGWVPSWIVPEADTSAAAASALLATGQAAAPEVRLPRPRRLSAGEPDERLRLAERLAADARQLRLYLPVGGAGPGGTVPAAPGVYASEKKKQQEWDAVSKDTAGATQQKPLTTATAKPQKRTQELDFHLQASAASDKVPQDRRQAFLEAGHPRG
ncbi:unnamed protein product [Effrenium voratum]|nr:unnamed protein product [Effrenium voratum]